MHKCNNCGEITSNGVYFYSGQFICRKCESLVDDIHIDKIIIEEAGPKVVELFFGVSEKEQRERFINFLYLLFNRTINQSAYRLMNTYRKKGFTWIGMLRAMEWFYLIKKNKTDKANNSIGIIPYIYEEAQKYYNIQTDKSYQKALHWHKNKNVKTTETIISKPNIRTENEIDMKGL